MQVCSLRLSIIAGTVLAGLFLIWSATAQAEKAVWKVGGEVLTETRTVSFSVEGAELKLPTEKPVITCKKLSLTGEIKAHGEGFAHLAFSECKAEGCTFTESPSGNVEMLLASEKGVTNISIQSVPGFNLLSFQFKSPCSLATSVPGGSLSMTCSDCGTSQKVHKAELSGSLEYEKKLGHLSATTSMELSGGGTWQTFAFPAGSWKVEGTSIAGSKEATGTLKGGVSLLMTLAGTPVKVTCNELKVKEGLILKEGLSSGGVEFKKCETFVTEKATPICNPVEPIKSSFKGVLLRGEPLPGKHHTYVHAIPAEGSILFMFEFQKECSLGMTKFPVEGSLDLECANTCEAEEVVHSMSQAPSEVFPRDGLKVAGTAITVTLDGSVSVSLLGAGEGKPWSGLVE